MIFTTILLGQTADLSKVIKGVFMMEKPILADYQLEINQIRNQFGFDFVALNIVNTIDYSPILKWQFASGNLNNRYQRMVLHPGKGIAGTVFKTGKPMLVKNIHQEIPMNELHCYPIIVAEGLKSLGAVPLWENYRVAGVLLVGFRIEDSLTDRLFDEFQQSIASGFCSFNTKEM